MGQGKVLQVTLAVSAGHARPPLAAGVMTARLSTRYPVPHVLEHGGGGHWPHGLAPVVYEAQSETMQSWGAAGGTCVRNR